MKKYKIVRFEVELIEPTGRPVGDQYVQEDFDNLLAEIDHNEELTLFYNLTEDEAREVCEHNTHNIHRITIVYDNGHEAPEYAEYISGSEWNNQYMSWNDTRTPSWCKKIFEIY